MKKQNSYQTKQAKIEAMKAFNKPESQVERKQEPVTTLQIGDCLMSPQGVTYQVMAITDGVFSNITLLRDDGMQFNNRLSEWVRNANNGFILIH